MGTSGLRSVSEIYVAVRTTLVCASEDSVSEIRLAKSWN